MCCLILRITEKKKEKKLSDMYRERQQESVRVRGNKRSTQRCLLSIYLLQRVCQRVWLVFYLCRWSGWAVFVAFRGNYPAGVALATADSRSPLQTAWHIDFLLWGVLFKPHLRFPSRPAAPSATACRKLGKLHIHHTRYFRILWEERVGVGGWWEGCTATYTIGGCILVKWEEKRSTTRV